MPPPPLLTWFKGHEILNRGLASVIKDSEMMLWPGGFTQWRESPFKGCHQQSHVWQEVSVHLLFKGSTRLDTDVKQSCICLPNPNTQHDTKNNKGALFYSHTVIARCNISLSESKNFSTMRVVQRIEVEVKLTCPMDCYTEPFEKPLKKPKTLGRWLVGQLNSSETGLKKKKRRKKIQIATRYYYVNIGSAWVTINKTIKPFPRNGDIVGALNISDVFLLCQV